jgi:hypothetical protein
MKKLARLRCNSESGLTQTVKRTLADQRRERRWSDYGFGYCGWMRAFRPVFRPSEDDSRNETA